MMDYRHPSGRIDGGEVSVNEMRTVKLAWGICCILVAIMMLAICLHMAIHGRFEAGFHQIFNICAAIFLMIRGSIYLLSKD
jgi:hypothetical protein